MSLVTVLPFRFPRPDKVLRIVRHKNNCSGYRDASIRGEKVTAPVIMIHNDPSAKSRVRRFRNILILYLWARGMETADAGDTDYARRVHGRERVDCALPNSPFRDRAALFSAVSYQAHFIEIRPPSITSYRTTLDLDFRP